MKNKTVRTTFYIVLCAAYLFFPGDLFGQDGSSKNQYKIKVIENGNGKSVNIDTTFTDHKAFKEYLDKEGIEMHSSEHTKGDKVIMYKFDGDEELSDEMKLEIEKAQKELKKSHKKLRKSKKELKGMKEELHNMQIEIENEDGEDRKIEIIIGDDDEVNRGKMNWISEDGEHGLSMGDDQMHFVEIHSDDVDGEEQVIIIMKKNIEDSESIIKKERIIESDQNDVKEDFYNEENNSIDNNMEGPQSFRIDKGKLKAFPNPTSGTLNITYSPVNDNPVELKLIDSRGRTMINDRLTAYDQINKEYNMEGYSKGTYLLQLKQGAYWIHEKIVVR